MNAAAGPFAHAAFLYRGDQDFVAGVSDFLRRGLAAGDPVGAAVPEPRLGQLRDVFGARVRLWDMAVVGRNPVHILVGVLRAFADDLPAAGRIWIVAEAAWPGRGPLELAACAEYEALADRALAGRPISLFCPYDAARLDGGTLAAARLTHPALTGDGADRASADYAPDTVLDRRAVPLPEPRPSVGTVSVLRYGAGNLAEVRDVAVKRAAEVGLSLRRAADIELAVSELAANSLRHGGGSGVLRTWVEAGYLIYETTDRGYLADPLAGHRPAGLSSDGGRGLLLMHDLSDLSSVHTVPGRTVVRACFHLVGDRLE